MVIHSYKLRNKTRGLLKEDDFQTQREKKKKKKGCNDFMDLRLCVGMI